MKSCLLTFFIRIGFQVSNRVLDVVEGLAMVNSCINPLVYGKYTFKQSDVEQAFKCLKPGTARRVVQCLGIVGTDVCSYLEKTSGKITNSDERMAVEYRIGMKKALDTLS